MKSKKFLRRSAMVLLFFGAIYATFSSISNVTFKDVHVWAEQKSEELSSFDANSVKQRDIALKEKTLNYEAKQKRYISSEHVDGPKTIQERMENAKYPTTTVLATGYTAGIESTGKTPDHPMYGITYSGVQVKRDLYSTIAADLDVYPIGTIMWIPGYGFGVVADKGSAINGNNIDLYYKTVEDVYEYWGKKEVEVHIVEMGDGSITEEELVELNNNEALQVFREQIIKS
ncbi:3D domain-containing protein [Virgibacillus necropolis]|uniref:3D domain-containing protein n=1 Tax=Virgibacillus necropolis TaxID=163877 RepID=UPI00384BAD76